MALFGFGKNKDSFVDLGEMHRKEKERAQTVKTNNQDSVPANENSSGDYPLAFFGGGNNEENNSSSDPENLSGQGDVIDLSDTINTRRKKLTKRILEMTGKMEKLSNEVYHLQQRIEVLERKNDVNRFRD